MLTVALGRLAALVVFATRRRSSIPVTWVTDYSGGDRDSAFDPNGLDHALKM
jgi:hypothetical protein